VLTSLFFAALFFLCLAVVSGFTLVIDVGAEFLFLGGFPDNALPEVAGSVKAARCSVGSAMTGHRQRKSCHACPVLVDSQDPVNHESR